MLQTDGVLNYSLTAPRPAASNVRAIFTVGQCLLIDALDRLGVRAQPRGISDVVVADRKISGNAQASRWGGLLLHGTMLCDIDFDVMEACLRHPPREPDYRHGRGHRAFMTTLRHEGALVAPREVEAAVIASAREL